MNSRQGASPRRRPIAGPEGTDTARLLPLAKTPRDRAREPKPRRGHVTSLRRDTPGSNQHATRARLAFFRGGGPDFSTKLFIHQKRPTAATAPEEGRTVPEAGSSRLQGTRYRARTACGATSSSAPRRSNAVCPSTATTIGPAPRDGAQFVDDLGLDFGGARVDARPVRTPYVAARADPAEWRDQLGAGLALARSISGSPPSSLGPFPDRLACQRRVDTTGSGRCTTSSHTLRARDRDFRDVGRARRAPSRGSPGALVVDSRRRCSGSRS